MEEQEGCVYQQCKLLIEAVMAGQITDWPEVEDLLFELMEFGYYDCPAWVLYSQLKKHIGRHFSSNVQRGSGFLKAIIESAKKGEK